MADDEDEAGPSGYDLAKEILARCDTKKGSPAQDIYTALVEHLVVSNAAFMECINGLASKGHLEFLGHDPLRVRATGLAGDNKSLEGASGDDRHIYQLIQQSGNIGIWSRDIKKKTNLPTNVINKSLKSLESKKLIKPVKTVVSSKKKVYMLYDMTPSRALTGGAFYEDEKFDVSFANLLTSIFREFLNSKREAAEGNADWNLFEQRLNTYQSAEDIIAYVSGTGVSNVDISLDDARAVLTALVFDRRVVRSPWPAPELPREYHARRPQWKTTTDVYRAVAPDPTQLAESLVAPCYMCPSRAACVPGGIISPTTCEYMNEWLSF